MTSKFIDLSSNNGTVIFSAVAAAGVTDIFMRLSMGFNSHDKTTLINAKAATMAGIAVSYYHLAYADDKMGGTIQSDATNEADYFVNCIQTLGIPAPKHVAIDLETKAKLDKQDYGIWLQTWLGVVETKLGIVPIIYTYTSYMDTVLPTNHSFGKYPLWIANYNNIPTPKLPVGWSEYALWQYSSTGKVGGIHGNVDLSKVNPFWEDALKASIVSTSTQQPSTNNNEAASNTAQGEVLVSENTGTGESSFVNSIINNPNVVPSIGDLSEDAAKNSI